MKMERVKSLKKTQHNKSTTDDIYITFSQQTQNMLFTFSYQLFNELMQTNIQTEDFIEY